MDTSRFIQSCNPARFIITSSLLIFSILFALKLDEYIKINYWLVFLPLFIWKMLVVLGGCTGIFVWCTNIDHRRNLHTTDNDCREMIIYLIIHIFLLIFELLTCEKLENHVQFHWIICFIPLILCTFTFLILCLWSMTAQRNFLIQVFISMNGFVFIFFPLRLDYLITWRYVIVFIPLWITLSFALLFVVIKFIIATFYRCSHRLLANQREVTTISEAIIYAHIFIPFTIFAILLVERFDNEFDGKNSTFPYSFISIPLWISLISWLSLSFAVNDCNPWWFGLRRSLCDIMLNRYPLISVYFNNQFKVDLRQSTNDMIIQINQSVTDKKNIEVFKSTKLCNDDMKIEELSEGLLQPD